jgi:hypothetical protein
LKPAPDILSNNQLLQFNLNIMKQFFILSAMALALFSCKKDKQENPEDQFSNFKAARKSKDQSFQLNGATGGLITGEKGTKVTFPANAFVDAANNPVTGGVIVTLNESLDPKAWIMDAHSTETNGSLLVSGGMIKLKAKRAADGADLQPNPALVGPAANVDSAIKGEVPRNNNRDMGLFLQKPIGQGGTGGSQQSTWGAAPYYPFGNGPNSYVFQIPEFKWVNCDVLYSDPRPKTTITVTPNLTGISGAADLQVCLVYRNIKTVITLVPAGNGFQSYTNSIPEGSAADVIIIGKNGSNQILFKNIGSTTFTTNMNISIKPEVSTAAQVDAYLNSL